MQPSKIKHANSVFNKKIGLDNVDFIKHSIIKERQLFKSFIEKREGEGRLWEAVVINDWILCLFVLS